MLIDDEFNTLLARFRKGVRIVVVSDSCHSGSVAKLSIRLTGGRPVWHSQMSKAAPDTVCKLANAAATRLPILKKPRVKAAVILLSACADNQLAYDGEANGLFTGTMAAVRKDFRDDATLNYKRLRNLVSSRMPAEQTPRISYLGARNKAFEASIPFKP
jgi:hypothetical protein